MTKEEYIDTNKYGYDENKGIWSKSKEKFLKGCVNKDGYVQVGLKCIDGKKRLFRYHRAMWYLAYGVIPEGMQVNHIREFEKTNNALSNLNLMTPKENSNWGTRTKRSAAKRRGISRPDVIEKQSKPVVAVDIDDNVVYEFVSAAEAGRQGFCRSAVCACCRNCFHRQGNRFFKGYYWYYKEDWLEMKNAVPHKRETA